MSNNDLTGDPEHLVMGVRREVAEFAAAMEAKLRKNDHKTGWKDQPIEAHIKLLRIEVMEFDVALEFLGDEVAGKECVDIANFALIIRDKLRARVAATNPNQSVDAPHYKITELTGPMPAIKREDWPR